MQTELSITAALWLMYSLPTGCAECSASSDCDIGKVCISGKCEPQPTSLNPGGGTGVNNDDGPQKGDDDTDGISLPDQTTADYIVSPYTARQRGCLEDAYLPTNPAIFVDEEELLLFFTEPSSTTTNGLSLFVTRSSLEALSFGPKEIVAFDAGPMDFVRDANKTFVIAGQDPSSAALFEGDARAQNWSLRDTAISQSETIGVCADEIAPRFVQLQKSPLQTLVGFEDPTSGTACRYRTWLWDFTQKDPVPVASGRPAGAAFFDDRLFAASTSALTFAPSAGGPFEVIDFTGDVGQHQTFHRLTSDDDRLYVLTSSLHGVNRKVSLLSAAGLERWDTFTVFEDRPQDEGTHLSQADMAILNGSIAVSWLLEDSVAVLTVSTDGGSTWSTPASFIVPVEGAPPRSISLTTDGTSVYGAFQLGGPPEVEDTRICFAAFDPPQDSDL